MKQFRVRKSTYYDEYGKESREYHYIQQLKSFLGFKYWVDIKHEIGSISGSWKETTRFDNYFDAYEFCIKLKDGLKRDGRVDEIVSYI